MKELILLYRADSDIQAAFDRYEEFQEGRGAIFMRQLDLALGVVSKFPNIAPLYAGAYRRMLIRDFPFGVFYQNVGSRIVVVAILDLRQEPDAIRRHLGS